MLSLDRLVFDPADAANGSKVGSHILAGTDGTAIGHVSDALKVSIANASIAVTATDLDIRDLAFATDKVDVSGSAVTAVVTATNLDIRDLVFATDKVDVSGSVISTSPYGMASAAYANKTVNNTATKIITTNLSNRLSVIVQNLGGKDIFFGNDSSVLPATGLRVGAGQSLELAWSDALDLYGITASGSTDVRYLESA